MLICELLLFLYVIFQIPIDLQSEQIVLFLPLPGFIVVICKLTGHVELNNRWSARYSLFCILLLVAGCMYVAIVRTCRENKEVTERSRKKRRSSLRSRVKDTVCVALTPRFICIRLSRHRRAISDNQINLHYRKNQVFI